MDPWITDLGWARTDEWVHDHSGECHGWTTYVERKTMTKTKCPHCAHEHICHLNDPVITDEDTFTFKELREVGGPGSLIQAILLRRETDYQDGTVVLDANHVFWRRSAQKTWRKFGDTGRYENHLPARPLTVIL